MDLAAPRPTSRLYQAVVVGLVWCSLLASTSHALRAVQLLRGTLPPVSAMDSMGHADHATPPTHPQHDSCPLCAIQFTESGPSDGGTVAWDSPKHQPPPILRPPPQHIHYLPTASRAPPTGACAFRVGPL
ncbi:MAG: hypothetical protein C4327_01590 [Meiothermus sp.]